MRFIGTCVVVGSVYAMVIGCSGTTAGVPDADASADSATSSDATTSPDTAVPTDATAAVDASADGSPLPTTCADAPNTGTNPTCGTVGACGAFVTMGSDANDVPIGTSTTLPPGTYVLTAIVAHKIQIPTISIKTTVRFKADGTYDRIESVTLNGKADSVDERKSGTYTVTAGVVQPNEVCPKAEADDPSTFTVNGQTVTFFTPQNRGPAGSGVVQTYTRL